MEKADVADQQMIDEPAETGCAKVIPQGAARRLPALSCVTQLPSSSKIATTPAPNGAPISAGRPAGAQTT